MPTRHIHHVPESQKLYGNADFAVSGQSGGQQSETPPVLRAATRTGHGIGGEHVVHQVGQHADGAEQPRHGVGAVGTAADAEQVDPIAAFPAVDQEFVCLGDRGPGVGCGGLAPPQAANLRPSEAGTRVPGWYQVICSSLSSSRRSNDSAFVASRGPGWSRARSKHSTMFFTATPDGSIFAAAE